MAVDQEQLFPGSDVPHGNRTVRRRGHYPVVIALDRGNGSRVTLGGDGGGAAVALREALITLRR